MTVNFMGLTGPQGVLPSTYTEYLIARTYSRDTAAVAFLDIFNHRLIALFYLAWEKHHFPVSYERESLSPKPEKRFTQYLFDLIGMGTQGLRERLEVEDEGLLLYAGLIAQRPHSAIALEGILRDYFQAPAAIEQFCGRWFPLEQDALCYLDSEGLHNQLGFGAVAGDLVWNQQAAFRVRLGPLAFERFNELLPGGAGFRRLVSIVRYFVNGSLDFDVQLVLAANEVPAFRLEDTPGSPRLGWSSWLKTVEFTADAGDAILPPSAAEKVTIAVAANASRAAL